MALHMLGYASSSSGTFPTQVNAVSDIITRSNNNYVLNHDMNLYAVAAVGANLSKVRLNTPSLRQVVLPYIYPVNVGATFPNNPAVQVYPFNSPLKLRAGEEIKVESSLTTGTTEVDVLLLIGDQITPAPQGSIYTLTGSSTTSAVADTWTQLSVTWNDSLAQGTYAVVGLNVINTTGIGARIYTDGSTYRPGGLCMTAVGNRTHELFRNGRLGQWLTFNNFTVFNVEVLCTGTDSSHTIVADIVKIG